METQSRRLAPLDDVLATRGHVRVLRALFSASRGMSFSAREVARRASISHPRAAAVLSSLRDQGLVHRRARARLHLYELNEDHVAVPALENLFDWERQVGAELVSFLKERLIRRRSQILAASLFGSVARGEMGSDGDIDLAIVTKQKGAKALEPWLDSLGEDVRRRFGGQLSPLIATPAAPKWPTNPPIWRKIRDEGIPLIHLSPSE